MMFLFAVAFPVTSTWSARLTALAAPMRLGRSIDARMDTPYEAEFICANPENLSSLDTGRSTGRRKNLRRLFNDDSNLPVDKTGLTWHD